MDAPLGRAVGNALEVIECLEVLKGRGSRDLLDVSVALTARMLVLGRVATDRGDAERRVRQAISSGEGLDRFRRIVEVQGGDPRIVDDYTRLPAAPARHVVTAPRSGYLTALDAALVGRASVALGAGRDRVDDRIDPAVGILLMAKPGDRLAAGDPVLELHYRSEATLGAARSMAARAVTIGDAAPSARPLIVGEVL
jgi:pyrimidine-nucleoside phosphorylase